MKRTFRCCEQCTETPRLGDRLFLDTELEFPYCAVGHYYRSEQQHRGAYHHLYVHEVEEREIPTIREFIVTGVALNSDVW